MTRPVPAGQVTVTVPATSANLGPGFDALGLALGLHDVVQARVLAAGLSIEVTGHGADAAAAGEDHLVIRAMRACFAALGDQPPGLAIRCANQIPQGFGLGSSAGAIVAGVLAATELAGTGLAGGAGHPAPLELAARLEGHPDNVAACLAGGLTIAWQCESVPRAARLTPLAALAPVLCVPPAPVATTAARQALPATVPHRDAAANAARAALLVAALTTDPELLLPATEDFLHQRYRAAAMPDTIALVRRLREAGIPAVVSGAGPAVLALCVTGAGPGAAEVADLVGLAGEAAGWRVLPLPVDLAGARVTVPG
ncbi:MAG TPA: homoserine kinase [Streptosporangiaceae bacterium]